MRIVLETGKSAAEVARDLGVSSDTSRKCISRRGSRCGCRSGRSSRAPRSGVTIGLVCRCGS
nr:hypothetical protein [Streptomyces sp. CBMA152]